jgi:hypothetical protein
MSDLAGVLHDLSAGSEYAQGALDVLALLGLVTLNAARAIPVNDVAAMALGSLGAHLADGVTVGLRWDDLDAEPPRGVDILRVIEQARVARVAQPTPGRMVEAAQSIIKLRRGTNDFYCL